MQKKSVTNLVNPKCTPINKVNSLPKPKIFASGKNCRFIKFYTLWFFTPKINHKNERICQKKVLRSSTVHFPVANNFYVLPNFQIFF